MIFPTVPPIAGDAADRRRNRYVAFGLLSLLAVCIFIKFRQFGIDDGFIVLRYVDNILHGRGWTFNPGEHHNASTSTLNTIVIAVIALAVGDPLRASIIAGCLGILCSGICLYLLLERRCSAIIGTIAAGCLMYFLAGDDTWGLETNMFIGLILLFLVIEEREGDGWWILGLIVLTRPDGIVLVGLKVLRDLLIDRKFPVRGIMKIIAVCAPWMLFSLFQFGQLAPATLRQKLWQGSSGFWGTGHIYLNRLIKTAKDDFLDHGVIGVLFLIPLAVGALRVIRERSVILYFVGFAAIQQSVYVVMNIPGYNWYFAPSEALGCILILVGLIHLISLLTARIPERFLPAPALATSAFALLGAVAVMAVHRPYLDRPLADSRTVAYTSLALDITGRLGTPSIAAREVGVVGYYSHARMIDLTGLTDQEPEFLTVAHIDRFFTLAPDVIVLTDTVDMMEKNIVRDPRFGARYALGRDIVTPGYRTMHYYIRRGIGSTAGGNDPSDRGTPR